MLVSLAIGNVVLIDRVDLAFGPGLCVLTGETGAGKSILLDSLGLALGMRANAGLVRGAAPALKIRMAPARSSSPFSRIGRWCSHTSRSAPTNMSCAKTSHTETLDLPLAT